MAPSDSPGGVMRFHLIRINDGQDFLFVRLGVDKKHDMLNAAIERAPGGVWVGEYVADDEEVKALVFVNAMKNRGPKREEVIDALNRAVSRLARRLEAQIAETFPE